MISGEFGSQDINNTIFLKFRAVLGALNSVVCGQNVSRAAAEALPIPRADCTASVGDHCFNFLISCIIK